MANKYDCEVKIALKKNAQLCSEELGKELQEKGCYYERVEIRDKTIIINLYGTVHQLEPCMDVIQSLFPKDPIYYFCDDVSFGIFFTNDKKGKYFPRYLVENNFYDYYFCRTMTEVYDTVSDISGIHVRSKLDDFIEKYNESQKENHLYIRKLS